MAKKTASTTVRVYPSTRRTLKRLAKNKTLAEVIDELLIIALLHGKESR